MLDCVFQNNMSVAMGLLILNIGIAHLLANIVIGDLVLKILKCLS